jgi:RecA-family ATPase
MSGDGDAYARGALDRECADLAHASAGRNEQLNKAAFALGQFVGADRLTQSEVESALFHAAVANGYVAKDGPAAARATIRSGIEKGSLEPRLNGAEPRRTASSFTNGRASAPSGDGALPSWTAPNEKGWPRFEAIGEGEPPSLRDEIPGRRHLYRRNGEPVRMKVKRRGGGFVDFYRVRRPDTGQIGWQAKKPAGYEPAPYIASIDPFDPTLSGDPIFVPEGEKDVDTLAAHGLAALSFGGSSDRPEGCEKWVAGRDIVILADNDEQGRDHARKLAACFATVASSVKIVEFPELHAKADVSDWLGEHGGTVEGLWKRIDAAQRFTVDSAPRIVSPRDLGDNSPARAWIVPEWLPCGVVTGLYGDGGLGKSLLAQQLQTAAATGKTWLGLTVEKTASLAVYCEDSNDELWRRQRDINLDYGVSNNDLGDAHWMPRLGEDNLMMVFGRNGAGELTKFHQHILIASLDLKARLVIVDTAADVFGGNENDRNHVRQFVSRALGSIALKIGGAVLLCAHPSRTGLTSGEGDGGSTGWSNALRSRLFLRAPALDNGEIPDPNAGILQRKKANYATRNDEIKLCWRNGVIEPEAPVSPGATAFGKIDVKDVFIGLLDEFTTAKRNVSADAHSRNFAPRLFGKLPRDQRRDFREADFNRAMETLFKSHVIENVGYGKPSDFRQKIGRGA